MRPTSTKLEGVLGSIPDEHPLAAVVHAAGVSDNAMIDGLTTAQLDRVLAPKLRAALESTSTHHGSPAECVCFVLLHGRHVRRAGAGEHAASNAFLDALTVYRRAHGLVGTSIAWGLWAGIGMGRELTELDMNRMTGSKALPVISEQEGLKLFDQAIASDLPIVMPTRLDRAALRAEASANRLPRLLSGLVPTHAEATPGEGTQLGRRLAAAVESDRARIVLELVQERSAAVLEHASSRAVVPTSTFKELGFDSLASVTLRNELEGHTGLQLPLTLIFDIRLPRRSPSICRIDLRASRNVSRLRSSTPRAPTSRSRSWGWRVATRGTSARPRISGGWWPTGMTQSRRSRLIAAGTSMLSMTLIPTGWEPLIRARGGSWRMPRTSTPASLGLGLARPGDRPHPASTAGDVLGGTGRRLHRPVLHPRQPDRRLHGGYVPRLRRRLWRAVTRTGRLASTRQGRERGQRSGRLHVRLGGTGGHR